MRPGEKLRALFDEEGTPHTIAGVGGELERLKLSDDGPQLLQKWMAGKGFDKQTVRSRENRAKLAKIMKKPADYFEPDEPFTPAEDDSASQDDSLSDTKRAVEEYLRTPFGQDTSPKVRAKLLDRGAVAFRELGLSGGKALRQIHRLREILEDEEAGLDRNQGREELDD